MLVHPASSTAATPGRNRALFAVGLVVSLGMGASLAYHGVQAFYLQRSYPYSTFLFRPLDHFMDFFNDYRYAGQFGPKHDMMAYSAPVMAVLRAAHVLPATAVFVALVAVFVAVLCGMVYRYGTRGLDARLERIQYTVLLGLFTYPVLFIIDRGNLDLLVFLALAGFFYLHLVKGSRWSWILLAFAISAKYYPATLLVLFLCDRRYREAVYAVLGAAGFTLLSAISLSVASGRSVAGVLAAVARQLGRHDAYSRTVDSVQHGHSLWGALTWIVGTHGQSTFTQDMAMNGVQGLSRPYLLVALLVFVLIAIYVVWFEKTTWRRVTLLVLGMVLLPYESHDYTLVLLYFPLMMLLYETRGQRSEVVYAVLLAVPLIPVDYYVFGQTDVAVSVFIYPFALVTVGVAIVVDGMALYVRTAHAPELLNATDLRSAEPEAAPRQNS